MKVALVGSSGYIALYLIKRLQKEAYVDQIIKIDQTKDTDLYLDLSEADKFDYSKLKDVDFVIFTAAVSGPDKCAVDFDFCWKINVEGTKKFINEAINNACRVLFFSSDAVFGDIPGYIYTEESKTRAVTPYGRMKKAVEDEFMDNLYFKAIRLSYVISLNDKFISYCLNCVKNHKEAIVFHPFYRNCITVSDVENVVIWFTQNFEQYEPSVLNVAGQELISRIRIADEINRVIGNKLNYSIMQPEKEFFKNRPQITQMQSKYINKYGILRNECFTEKIQKEMKGLTI